MKPLYLLCFGVSLMAQDAAPGWHRFGERDQSFANPSPQGQVAPNQTPSGQAPYSNQQQYPAPMQQQPQFGQSQQPYFPPQYQSQQGPIDLTIAPGTWITVRINEPISSEHAQSGDAFLATLAQPIVVNGLVVARRGQTVQGRVTNALRAGRIKGTSSLGIQITELGLVDGQQVPVNTQFVERHGDTSVGQDLGAIGLTTGLGAAIGAAAGGGWGAGIGALAGAAVGSTGVLSSRGRDSVLFPEQVLTFRLEAPVHITSQAGGAFQPGSTADYERTTHYAQQPLAGPAYQGSPYYGSPYYSSPYYGGYGSSLFYGPSFYFGTGGGYYYGRGHYYGRRR